MVVPWLRILNAAVGVAALVGRVSGRSSPGTRGRGLMASLGRPDSQLDTRLAGVVVAALKEAFDRDHRRLEIERERVEAERERMEAELWRAERALRLELARQAAERELSRLRLLAGVAVAILIATLVSSASFVSGSSFARVSLGVGWLLLLASLAATFSGQTRIARTLDRILDHVQEPSVATDAVSSGPAGAAAPWLIVGGAATIAVGILVG